MPSRASSGSLQQLGEFGFIERLSRRLGRVRAPVRRGIGDDAAVVQITPDRALLLATDLLVEGIHFTRSTATMEDVGYKAAVSNFSDIAAMGGAPQYLLMSFAAPPTSQVKALDGLYTGLLAACRRYRVTLIGGDTSSSQRHLFLSVTVTGSARSGRILMRSGARVGDLLYVTGTLGDSFAGLQLLQSRQRRGGRRSRSQSGKHAQFLMHRHLRPTARVEVGQALARHQLVTAALDVSDGLSGDLRHLCQQSGVGAEIQAAGLPLSRACRWYAERGRVEPGHLALMGGEDYELLVAVPPRHRNTVERLARKVGVPITHIGTITPRRGGIKVKTLSGEWRTVGPSSYQHFRAKRTGKRRL